MKVKVIRTEEEYKEALGHLESLMDAAPGSPEEDTLEVLSLLIERYEEEHFPVNLPDPIQAIKFRMEQQSLTQKDMQKYIGSQSKVSEVLNYKRPLSLNMIRSLNEGLGIPAEVLLQEPGGVIGDPEYDWREYPFVEMFNQGYFSNFDKPLYQAKEYGDELLIDLFSVFDSGLPEQVYCRNSDKEMDSNALKAWHARVLQIASAENLPEYSRDFLNDRFFREVISLSQLSEGPQLAKEYLNNKGIHFIVLKHLPKTYLDGACFKSIAGAPIIGMTLRHDRLDNFWFTLAHELAHLYFHLNDDNRAYFDDTDNVPNPDDPDCEPEADDFAGEILIKSEIWASISDRLLTHQDPDEIQEIARELSISPAIIAGRIRWETKNFFVLSNLIGQGQVRSQYF
jgi:HTH-type transcriptional regulator/antitoxin HigA